MRTGWRYWRDIARRSGENAMVCGLRSQLSSAEPGDPQVPCAMEKRSRPGMAEHAISAMGTTNAPPQPRITVRTLAYIGFGCAPRLDACGSRALARPALPAEAEALGVVETPTEALPRTKAGGPGHAHQASAADEVRVGEPLRDRERAARPQHPCVLDQGCRAIGNL